MKVPLRYAILASLLWPLVGTAGPLDGAALYTGKTCFTCHGQDGKNPTMTAYPRLAGQNADYAYTQMVDIKSGARNNGQTAAMKGVMGLVNDQEIKALAEYLSKLK